MDHIIPPSLALKRLRGESQSLLGLTQFDNLCDLHLVFVVVTLDDIQHLHLEN